MADDIADAIREVARAIDRYTITKYICTAALIAHELELANEPEDEWELVEE